MAPEGPPSTGDGGESGQRVGDLGPEVALLAVQLDLAPHEGGGADEGDEQDDLLHP